MSQSEPPSPLRSPLSRTSYEPLALEKSFRPLEKDEGRHNDGGEHNGHGGEHNGHGGDHNLHDGNTLDEADEQSSGDESDDSFNSALGSPSSVPRTSSVPGGPTSESGSVSGDSSNDSGEEGNDTDEQSGTGEQEHGDRLSELNSPSTPKHPSTSGHTHPSIPKHPFAGATKIEVLHDRGVIDVEEEVRAYAALRRAASEDAMHERFMGPARANTTSNTFSVRPRRRPRSPSPAPTSIVLADHSGESAAFARDVRIPGWTCVGPGPGGYVVYECVVATRERADTYSQASASSNTPAPRQRTTSFMPTTSTTSFASSISSNSSSSSFTFNPATPPSSSSSTPSSSSSTLTFTHPSPLPRPPTHRRQKSTPGPTIRVYKRYSEFAALDQELRQTLPMAARAHVPPLPPANALARFRPRFLASRRAQLEAWLMRVLLHPDIGGTRAVREWMCV